MNVDRLNVNSLGTEKGEASLRITDHPILGKVETGELATIWVDGRSIEAVPGEPIAAALMAAGIKALHYTHKKGEPRGVFCAIGRCNDCLMTVDGVPNVRTCVTPVRAGMRIQIQVGHGRVERPAQAKSPA